MGNYTFSYLISQKRNSVFGGPHTVDPDFCVGHIIGNYSVRQIVKIDYFYLFKKKRWKISIVQSENFINPNLNSVAISFS